MLEIFGRVMMASLCWLLVAMMLREVLVWGYGLRRTLQRQMAIPCHRCRYAHSGHPYLKCAVQPTLAFTSTALECRDYQAHPVPLR